MKEMVSLGHQEYIPFFATITGIIFTDLLTGIGIGMAFGIFFTLKVSYENSHSINITEEEEGSTTVHSLELAEEVTFLNKTKLLSTFKKIPDGAKVVIDYSRTKSIATDVDDIIETFIQNSPDKNIIVEKIKKVA
jgi:SulP family sulfate permease